MIITKKIPLETPSGTNYTAGIYNYNTYKFTLPAKNSIDIYTVKLDKKQRVKSLESINTLAYNHEDKVYYASVSNDFSNIYVLNKDFCKVKVIKLNIPNIYRKKIYSIAYHKGLIYINIKNTVYSIYKDGNFNKEELSSQAINFLKEVRLKACCKIETCINITCVAYLCNKLYIGYLKNNVSYIANIDKQKNISESFLIEEDITVKAILSVDSKLQLLINNSAGKSFIYKTNKIFKTNLCNNCCYITDDDECRIDIECDCCLDHIIKSIACIENALAEIIHSESKKINKAVKISEDVCQLIKVNDSVARTIMNITLLEDTLTQKLKVTLDKIDCKKDHDC